MKKHQINEFIEFSDERFTKRIIFKENKTTVFMLNFKPGQALPAHKHPGSNVQLLMLNGTGAFKINGEDISATANDTIFINGDEELAFYNNGDSNVSLYVMLNKIPDDKYAQDI